MRASFTLTAIAVLGISAVSAWAAPIVNWNFNTNPVTTPNGIDSHLTASLGFSASTLTLATDPTGASNTQGIKPGAIAPTSTTEAAAVANDDYFSIVLKPASGYKLNLTDVTVYAYNGGGVGSVARSFSIRSSLDNFEAVLGAYSYTGQQSGTPVTTLSGFTGLTQQVEFRVYEYTTAAAGLIFDNLSVGGTVVAVPEPASLMVLLPAAGLLLRRRA